MKLHIKKSSILLFLLFSSVYVAQAQVKATKLRTKGGDFLLSKEIPDRTKPEITGKGVPVGLYVVQLARFEEMSWDDVPLRLPKGTFLWINPDHDEEALLLAGFFNTFDEAEKAAEKWKRKGKEFNEAFAREKPFMVEYR